MTKEENKLLEANRKLVDEKTMLLRDILVLIKYIDGNANFENIEEIIKYYKKFSEKRGPKREKE